MIRLLLFSGVLTYGACLPLDSGRILAKDFARANDAFAVLDPARDMGPAPLAGVRRIFSSEELSRIAKRYGVESGDSFVDTCFERTTSQLTADRLLPVLVKSLDKDARVQIDDFSRVIIPNGALEFPIGGLASNGFWRGRVVFEGRSTPLWAKIHVFDQTTGEAISVAPVRAIPTSLAPKEIERGDAVRVEVLSGGVLLALDAAAETGGRIGERILVKSVESGRRFQATVAEKGKVTIQK